MKYIEQNIDLQNEVKSAQIDQHHVLGLEVEMDDVRVVDEDQSLHHLDNKPGRFIIRLGKSGSTMAMEKRKIRRLTFCTSLL